jgi:hypothetical protein
MILLQFRTILLPNKVCLKVETISKGILDSMLSPSVKIQIVGGKICSSNFKKIGGFCGNWRNLEEERYSSIMKKAN